MALLFFAPLSSMPFNGNAFEIPPHHAITRDLRMLWYLKVLKSDGTQLGSVQACSGTSRFLVTLTLPATETYTLLIDPSDMQVGTVDAAVYTVNHVTDPLATNGTPVTVPLTTPGQNGQLTFSGTTLFLDTVTLPAAETYTLLIDPSDAQGGTVDAAVYMVSDVSGPMTTDGTPVTVVCFFGDL